MKFRTFSLLFAVLIAGKLFSQNIYESNFTGSSLRMDFYLSGGDGSELAIFKCWKNDPYWASGEKQLFDHKLYGKYILRVFDSTGSELLFSKSFNTLFQEWQGTELARKTNKVFEASVSMPFPRKSVVIKIFSKDRHLKEHLILEKSFDPGSSVFMDNPVMGFNSMKIYDKPENKKEKVDLVFIADGYRQQDSLKLLKDAKRVMEYMFSYKPFDKHRKDFRVWLVFSYSDEAGTDIPTEGIYRNTILNTSFNTFGSERYLTTESYFRVKDVAAHVPYEQVCILVNHDKYGGGGFYNFYSILTSDNEHCGFLFNHEFGHAFAGLADEYEGNVKHSYEFSLDVEPTAPNITTLVDFNSKWKEMLDENTPVPTPESPQYSNEVGVFEGGGYLKEGVYRPFMDCTMRSVSKDNFCPVCKKAIEDMIELYTE